MADETSPKWTVRTVIADALEELNPHISGDAAYEAAEGVLTDLTAPEHRPALVAWLVEAGVVPGEVRHVIEFYADGWAIEHPLACRVDGALVDCPTHARVVEAAQTWDGPPKPAGRYWIDLDNDEITLCRIGGTDG